MAEAEALPRSSASPRARRPPRPRSEARRAAVSLCEPLAGDAALRELWELALVARGALRAWLVGRPVAADGSVAARCGLWNTKFGLLAS